MEPKDFITLLNNALCLIGNSSVGIRECAFLGVPVVNIGSRQAGRERGVNVIDCDYSTIEITQAVQNQISRARYPSDNIYGNGKSGEKIAQILAEIPLQFDKKITF